MSTIVVGGHSRNIGKTSVVAGLIAALPEYHWTAVKISQHGHGMCSADGKDGACAADSLPFSIMEESERHGRSDTSRFLAAGASRSLWVRVKQEQLTLAMPRLLAAIGSDPFVIIESNSILRLIQPDLYIIVLRFDVEDFKNSAREMLMRADAAVVVKSRSSEPVWRGISRAALSQIRLFPTAAPEHVPEGLVDLIRSRLGPLASPEL